MMNGIVAIVTGIQSELILFALAIALHRFFFTDVSNKKKTPGKAIKKHLGSFNGIQEVEKNAEKPTAPLVDSCQAAYDRGDHRGVLRIWTSLRRSGRVESALLACVVESMQRLNKESHAIASEIREYAVRNASQCDVAFFNHLLHSMVKSLDVNVINGIVDCMQSAGTSPNGSTYEALIQLHFSTRSFSEVSVLAGEMKSKKVTPTSRTRLILLKTAIATGSLSQALRYYKEVAASSAACPGSVVPEYLATQLAELACRERCPHLVLQELEASSIPVTSGALKALLEEAARSRDQELDARVKLLATTCCNETSGTALGQATKPASADTMRRRDPLAAGDIAQTLLAHCAGSDDVALAEQLYQNGGAADSQVLVALVRFHAEAGRFHKACELYDKALKQASSGEPTKPLSLDSRTERCLVIAALQCGREDILMTLLEGSPAEASKYLSLIRGCASKGSLSVATRLFGLLQERGIELSVSLWNTLLDACVECKEFDEAAALLKQMQGTGIVDQVSYNTMIKAYLQQGLHDGPRALMQDMRTAGLAPNHVTYNEIINAVAKYDRDGRRSEVWNLVEDMKSNGIAPNRITCSILLKTLRAKSSSADLERTMALIEAMEEPMDEVLLSSLVEACVRIGKPQVVAQKLEQYRGKKGLSITGAHTFGSLIKAFGYAKDVNGAWRCWTEMRSQHVKPTSITIGCMVEAVASNGDVDGAYELIVGLLSDEDCREQVNAVVFGSILKGYGRTRRLERVIAVFGEMLVAGIEPSAANFNAVIDACARNDEMHRVPALLADMKARGLRPNLITFSTIIKGFCLRGDMNSAIASFEEMRRDKSLQADEIVYNTLIDGCAQIGAAAEGERILSEMLGQGIAPSSYTLVSMVRLLGQAGRTERAFELTETLTQKYRFKANALVKNALMQVSVSNKHLQRAVSIYEQMLREHLQLDPRTCQALIRSLIAAGKQVQAVSLLRSMLGLSGTAPVFSERPTSNALSEEAFINDAMKSLNAGGSEGAALAQALAASIRAQRQGLSRGARSSY
eukprot:CAMPEP_0170592914 /NCGR_PEP_ID=MMETSP0224-20130122/13171_1 /TAXON_ID=285029 /ORGANISM="Togula jolla, Strain CCCM 725" /LENGTH=1031 /DNA_ID=CAMNT_0010916837 /DNA_START=96 /DNA_END=3191 /DNA_ORIENTATION=-